MSQSIYREPATTTGVLRGRPWIGPSRRPLQRASTTSRATRASARSDRTVDRRLSGLATTCTLRHRANPPAAHRRRERRADDAFAAFQGTADRGGRGHVRDADDDQGGCPAAERRRRARPT